mgnify:CR=1 FL=1
MSGIQEEAKVAVLMVEQQNKDDIVSDLNWLKKKCPYIYYPLLPLLKYQSNKILKKVAPSAGPIQW